MDEYTFQREIFMARSHLYCGERPDYWLGYEHGLIHGHRGERFGTDRGHELWLTLAAAGEASPRDRGQGYRDGVAMAFVEAAA